MCSIKTGWYVAVKRTGRPVRLNRLPIVMNKKRGLRQSEQEKRESEREKVIVTNGYWANNKELAFGLIKTSAHKGKMLANFLLLVSPWMHQTRRRELSSWKWLVKPAKLFKVEGCNKKKRSNTLDNCHRQICLACHHGAVALANPVLCHPHGKQIGPFGRHTRSVHTQTDRQEPQLWILVQFRVRPSN